MTDTPDLAERRTVDGRLIEHVARPALAVALDLAPHPEGGWYRRTWTSPHTVAREGGGERPSATMILFHLPAGEASAWHRVASSELWIWNGALADGTAVEESATFGTVTLQYGGTGAEPREGESVVLGDPRAGHVVQAVVPPDVWQRTLPAAHDALVTCVVSPGFDFADFEMPGADGRS